MTPIRAVFALLITASTVAAGCRKVHSQTDSTQAQSADTRPHERQRDSIRVPIFVYHSIAHHHDGQTGEQRELDVDTTVFRMQMDDIARGKHPVVSLDALVDAIQGKGTVPAGAVVITFDDGWLDQYEDAFPILQRLRFTATFFIYTAAIGNGPAFMTWDEIHVMQQAGMTIGAHSRTHPDLTKRDVDLTSEIVGSRGEMRQHLGVAPDLFAYPYGAWDARIASAVRAAGFRAARALGDGPVNTRATRFELRSILATDDMQAFERALRDAR